MAHTASTVPSALPPLSTSVHPLLDVWDICMGLSGILLCWKKEALFSYISQVLWLWLTSLRRRAVDCLCVCPCDCLSLVCSLRKVVCLSSGVGERGGGSVGRRAEGSNIGGRAWGKAGGAGRGSPLPSLPGSRGGWGQPLEVGPRGLEGPTGESSPQPSLWGGHCRRASIMPSSVHTRVSASVLSRTSGQRTRSARGVLRSGAELSGPRGPALRFPLRLAQAAALHTSAALQRPCQQS